MNIVKSKIKNILREFDHKLDEYCFYNENSSYVVVQAIGKYDKDIYGLCLEMNTNLILR